MNEHNKSLVTGIIIAFIIVVGAIFITQRKQPPITDPTPSVTVSQTPSDSPSTTTSVTPTTTSCITAQEAYNEIGQTACVEYTVGYATESGSGNVFLDEYTDYTRGFTVTIYSEDVSKFNNPVSEYQGQTIDVTGTIAPYEGHPEIIVSDPSQITVQ